MSAIERLSEALSEIPVQEGLEDSRYAMFCIGDLREIEEKMKILEESNEFLEFQVKGLREDLKNPNPF